MLIDNLKAELAEVKESEQQKERQVRELERGKTQLEDQLRAQRHRGEELEGQLNLANGRVKAAREEAAQLKTQVGDLQAFAADLSHDKTDLESKLAYARGEVQNAKAALLKERQEHALDLERADQQLKEFKAKSEAQHRKDLEELAAAKDK